MRLRLRLVFRLAALPPVLAACGDDGGLVPMTVLRPAAIAFYGDSAAVAVPGEVRAGLPFVVTVQSFGGGCTAQDQTGVTIDGLRADVRPTVREPHPSAGVACDAMLRTFTHSAPVTFSQPGTATVIVYGRQEPGDAPRSVTRTVRVVP
jgi:hypothetical protein